jgi:predicted HNH restriction endonuclease
LGYRDHALFEQYLREPDTVTLKLTLEERNTVKNFHKPFKKAIQRHERNGSKSDIPSESQVSEWAAVVKKKLWDVASCVYLTIRLKTANANSTEEEKSPDYKIEFPLRDDCFLLWELGKNPFMILSRDIALSQRSRCYTCETDLINIYGNEAIEPFHVQTVRGKKTIISEGEGSGILLCPRCYALASQLELSLDDLKLRFSKRT